MSSGSTAAESLSTCFQSVSPEWMAFLARFADTDQEIAYYPSAGLDFHPALYWKKEGMRLVLSEVPEGYSEPDLWIFSDYFHSGQPDLFDRDFLHRDDRTTMRFESICEISADPEHFLYRHNRNYTGHQSSALTGRAFYFRALVESHKLEPYHFDGIYFYYENVNLLDQFFLRHSVPVSHLVWKRDGAGFGGGKLRHEFLLPLSALMGTRWFYLSDQSVSDQYAAISWPTELASWRDQCPTSIDLHSLGEFQWDAGDCVAALRLAPLHSNPSIQSSGR